MTIKKIGKISGKKLTVGRALCAIRKRDDMSQAEFAKKLGISKQYLSDIENGNRNVNCKSASAYAKKLGQSEKQFVCLALQDMINRNQLKMRIEIHDQ